MNEKVAYWLELADYDIDTARVMLRNGKYLYVGFMCHQTIEKALKAVIAYYCADNEIPPKTHDLGKLAIRSNLFDIMTDSHRIFIEYLNPLNIEASYPEYKKHLLALLTHDKCKDIIAKSEELLCWIKEQL